ncbi:MAG: endonuclease/exonuclease/phosphatase family protein [Firmicutes bacterium]|nr:endonuclease/exonuclease/phosphatase family protein [Bacillota bacterium]
MRRTTLKAMSFNVRYDIGKFDRRQQKYPYMKWGFRKDMVARQIRAYMPDVLGAQELMPHQRRFLRKALPEYGMAGRPRVLSVYGEGVYVFYRRDRFDLLESEVFWLSPTPERVSRGWDSSIHRIVTWARLKDKQTHQVFSFAATHFDHKGKTARMESAKLVNAKMRAGKDPAILVGDFNSGPDSPCYQTLTNGLLDAGLAAAQNDGRLPTHNSFDDNRSFSLIDYILVTPQVEVEHYAVQNKKVNGYFVSDHYAIVAGLTF